MCHGHLENLAMQRSKVYKKGVVVSAQDRDVGVVGSRNCLCSNWKDISESKKRFQRGRDLHLFIHDRSISSSLYYQQYKTYLAVREAKPLVS